MCLETKGREEISILGYVLNSVMKMLIIHIQHLLHTLGILTAWVLILALPFASCVMLGKLLTLKLPQFSYLQIEEDDNTMY